MHRERFCIHTGIHEAKDWTPQYTAYKSKEDALQHERHLENLAKVERFSFYSMNAEEIREVISVIEKFEERIKRIEH